MDRYIFATQINVLPQIKFWHWQTEEHAVHVALGDLYDQLSELLDTIVEAWQGKTQTRITVKHNGSAWQPSDWESAETAATFVSRLIENTVEEINELKKLDSYGDIINLLEELNGVLAKSMYLLTLK